jgi:hypothetical protein
MAGKGDAPRTVNPQKYRQAFDGIDWGRDKPSAPKSYRMTKDVEKEKEFRFVPLPETAPEDPGTTILNQHGDSQPPGCS